MIEIGRKKLRTLSQNDVYFRDLLASIAHLGEILCTFWKEISYVSALRAQLSVGNCKTISYKLPEI